eukprot:2173066-Amphidinium_carterae.2
MAPTKDLVACEPSTLNSPWRRYQPDALSEIDASLEQMASANHLAGYVQTPVSHLQTVKQLEAKFEQKVEDSPASLSYVKDGADGYVVVDIDKAQSADKPLGLKVRYSGTGVLVVSHIIGGGAVEAANLRNREAGLA